MNNGFIIKKDLYHCTIKSTPVFFLLNVVFRRESWYHIHRSKHPVVLVSVLKSNASERVLLYPLDGLTLGLANASAFAALLGPWEVCDGDDEE